MTVHFTAFNSRDVISSNSWNRVHNKMKRRGGLAHALCVKSHRDSVSPASNNDIYDAAEAEMLTHCTHRAPSGGW